MSPIQIDINKNNSYIIKEDNVYVLYYNGTGFLASDNKEDLEKLLE